MSPAQRLKDIFGVDFQEQPDITHLRQFHANNAFCSNEQEEIIGICACENAFSSLDLPVAGLEQLIYLNLSDNESLGELSFEGPLPQLQHLDLSDSQVRELVFPEGFEALTWLDLSRNQLQQLDLPRRLPSLWYADISGNKLSELSLQAPKLQYLYLNSNELTKLEFPTVPEALEVLQVRDNQLDKLPDNFLEFKALKILFLHGNPMNSLPPGTVEEGETTNSFVKVQSYLFHLEGGKKIENDEVKLVVLGNSTTGKTSLIRFLIEKIFVEDDILSTHGIQSKPWPVEKGLNVNVWDFGGQEYYHATHRLFLTKNTVSLVLFDEKTNEVPTVQKRMKFRKNKEPAEDILDIQCFPYSYWLDSLHYYAQGLKKDRTLIVQSQIEGANAIEVSIGKEVPYKIDPGLVFRIDTKQTADKKEPYIQEFAGFRAKLIQVLKQVKAQYKIRAEWPAIKTSIRSTAQKEPYVSYKVYTNLCEKILPGISQKTEEAGMTHLDNLTSYLHEIGVILYYGEIPSLKDFVFINPEWVTNIIYEVLDRKVMDEELGKFDRAHVKEMLGEQVIEGTFGPDQVIGLMKEFELIFPVDESEILFVAPQYLPDKGESVEGIKHLIAEGCNQLAFVLNYPRFLPNSLITRFICRYGKLDKQKKKNYWKKGIYFYCLDSYFYVEQITPSQIHIWCQNEHSEGVQDIFQTFQELNERNPMVEISVNGEGFYSYSGVRRL